MEANYEDKTAAQWISLLQSGDVAERSAAALALAELDATMPSIRKALIDALGDSDPPAQAAAQIALGLVEVNSEHRRKMFFILTGNDSERQSQVFDSLWHVLESTPATISIVEKPAVPGQESGTAGKSPTPAASTQTPPPDPIAPALETPDISIVHVFPWWFLVGGVAFCLTLAWLLRGLWWSKWTVMGMGAVAGLYLLYAHGRIQTGGLTRKQYRARRRIAGSVMVASVAGFIIDLLFPTGAVFIDNASGADARLLVDDKEWTIIAAGESKKLSLSSGRHRLTVQATQGNQILDAYDIEVTAYQQHVCNVLGAQVYFHGKVGYGGGQGADMKVILDRWFAVPEVDYLFRDPPRRIQTQHPIVKTFLSKGAPPQPRGED